MTKNTGSLIRLKVVNAELSSNGNMGDMSVPLIGKKSTDALDLMAFFLFLNSFEPHSLPIIHSPLAIVLLTKPPPPS